MHTVFALLCIVVFIHWLIFPYPSGLLHWHCGNLTIAPVPAKQTWWIWINTWCEFITNDCITATKQSTTKPCAYFLGYTVYWTQNDMKYVSHSIILPNLIYQHIEAGTKWTPFRRRHFNRISLNENVWIPIKISLKFVPKGPMKNTPALIQIMTWRRSGDKPLSEPMMISLLTHICVTRPQWVNTAFVGDSVRKICLQF